jgi:MFS family permease
MEHKKQKMTFFRWIIVSLMFIAITFNYADREIWVLVEPAFAHAFGWFTGPISGYTSSAVAVGDVSIVLLIWSLAYAIMNFPAGWITDKLGIRKAMTLMFGIWSTFTILTAATFNLITMAIVRAFMGGGEGAVWPINAKVTKNWANRFDESKAFTFAGAGQAVGPIVGLIFGAAIYAAVGWQWVFIIFGSLGLVLTAVWYFYVRDTPTKEKLVNKAELDYIQEGKPKAERVEENKLSSKSIWRITGKVIFGTQAGWGTFLVFLSFGYILFTFLYWLPPLMFADFAHSVTTSGIYAALVDIGLVVGYFGSGPFNDGLLKRFPKVTARRIGAILPMSLMIVMVGISYFTGTARELIPTAILLAAGAGLMNLTVGSWAVNAVDLAPSGTSATVYGVYNGSLNFVGAFNAIIVGYLFIHASPGLAFASAIIFMVMFLGGYLGLIRKSTWQKALDYGAKLLEEETKKGKATAKRQ